MIITFLFTHFPQAELWRIHKSNVNKLDASVIEVSDKGRVNTVVESGFMLCAPNDCVRVVHNQHHFDSHAQMCVYWHAWGRR